MTIYEKLSELQEKALHNEEIRARFLSVRNQSNPLAAFCNVCREYGYEIYPMDVIAASEESYAAMKRSTNGGGENSPQLAGEGDLYEDFYAVIMGSENRGLKDRFEFRNILPEETEQAIKIEQVCFPPNEACSAKNMTERIKRAPELFLVAVDKKTGKIAGFLNGLSTNEDIFRDEFFTDAQLYDPEGRNIMLLGLDVLPEYRRQGLASEIMSQYLKREREKEIRRDSAFLTCKKSRIPMYEKMGYNDCGVSDSTWGGEEWHDMICRID